MKSDGRRILLAQTLKDVLFLVLFTASEKVPIELYLIVGAIQHVGHEPYTIPACL